VVKVYYVGGPANGKLLDCYDTIKCSWKSTCEHIIGDEKEGFFAISEPIKSREGSQGYVYQHVDCEHCARKKGIIW
jgi:hypothetical protein